MSSIATPTKAKIATLTTPDGSEQILPRTVAEAVSGLDIYAKSEDVNLKETPAGAQEKATLAVTTHNAASTAHMDIRSALSAAQQLAQEAKSLAEGRSRAVSYTGYSSMVAAVNIMSKTAMRVGDNLLLEALGVPDLWVSTVEATAVIYTYTTDEALEAALENGPVQMGYYKLTMLETPKVDLSGYVPKTTTINGKQLTGNITLTAGDVGARAATWVPTPAEVGLGKPLTFTGATSGAYDGTVAKTVNIPDATSVEDSLTSTSTTAALSAAQGKVLKDLIDSMRPKVMTVKIDLANSNPATCCTYGDDAETMTPGSPDWDKFFGEKPCLFKDGAVVGYLNPNDFTKFEDGTAADITSGNAGDVMIEFPRRGLTMTTVGDILTIRMTDNLNDANFKYYAHQRGADRKENFYLGAYKGRNLSSKLRSLSGKTPTESQTIGTFRTQARANGLGYDQSGFYQLMYRQCMFVLKYKELNSQLKVGMGNVSSSLKSTGTTNTRGMTWGSTSTAEQMKLFGIEDFWGNIFEWIDGITTDASWNMLTNTSNFQDDGKGSGYMNNGQSVTSIINGYMSKPQGKTETGFLVKEVGGSSTTYFSDCASLYGGAVACFGGDWSNGSNAGAFYLDVSNSASGSYSYIGGRLMYL